MGGSNDDLDDGELGLQGVMVWEPSETAQWPMGPPQAEEDVGYLPSMLTARLRLGTP